MSYLDLNNGQLLHAIYKPIKNMKYVITGTAREFNEYQDKTQNLYLVYVPVVDQGPDPYGNTIYPWQGVIDPEGVFYGTWYKRPDIITLMESLSTRMHSARKQRSMDSVRQIYHSVTAAPLYSNK